MRFLKSIFNFYINSSIHVALSVYSLTRITEFYLGLSYNENLNYFIFFGTITGYNFVKYAGVAKLHHRSLTTHLKIIQIFSFLCFLVMCFYAFWLSVKTLLFSVPFSLLTVLYAVPFLSGFHKNLRQVSYLKVIVVAFVWMGFTVLIPVFDTEKKITLHILLLAVQRFLIVLVLILPFDIRDVQFDAISLQTIPKKIGIHQTKKLGLLLLLITLIVEFIVAPATVFKNTYWCFFMVLVFFLMRAKINQTKFYSSFWVESLPIFWCLALYVML